MKMISAITTFKTPATGMANNIPSGPINVPPINRTSICLLYTSPSPRDKRQSRMPSSA